MSPRTVLIAMAGLVMAACSSSQGTSDGSAGTGGGAGTAGSGGSASGNGGTGGRGPCSAYSGNVGCLCSSGGSSGGAGGTLSECSPASVAMGDQGVCCDDGSSCSCYRIACISVSPNTVCSCGGVAPDAIGTRVAQCSKPAAGVCCFANSSEPFRCRCSAIDTTCLAGETEVQSCSLADVMKCSTGHTMPDRCK